MKTPNHIFQFLDIGCHYKRSFFFGCDRHFDVEAFSLQSGQSSGDGLTNSMTSPFFRFHVQTVPLIGNPNPFFPPPRTDIR
jgi:hypothetical protein